MAGCYSFVCRRMKRYCCCYRRRLFLLLLVGFAVIGFTVWSFGEDNRTLHSVLLSLKQHGDSMKTNAQLKYSFLDWNKDPSEKSLHFGSRKNTHPDDQINVQGQHNEALQPDLPQINQFEHQMQKFNAGQPGVPAQDKPNLAPHPALPNEQKSYHRQPHEGPDQKEFIVAPSPALPQGQNNNPGQPNAAPNMGQLYMAANPALPQGQDNNPGQPNAAPDMAQLNMAANPVLPQGQNNNPGQPNAAPNMGQLNMAANPVLPQGQDNNPGQPNAAPDMAQLNMAANPVLPQGQHNNPGQPNAAPNMGQLNMAANLALPQGQNNNPGQPNAAPNMGQLNMAANPALPQGQNGNPGQPNAAPNMGQLNMESRLILPQGQNINPGQPNGAPNMGQLNMESRLILPQGQNINPGQPNAAPIMSQLNKEPQLALPQMHQVEVQGQNLNNGIGHVNEANQPAVPQVNQELPRMDDSHPGMRQGGPEAAQSQMNLGVAPDEVPVILSWHHIGGPHDMTITCGSRKCLMVKDHEEWKKHDYMAITFYGTDFGAGGFPIPRKQGHLWSVIHEESPKNNDWLFCAKSAMSIFNLTATFKRQSHYSFPTMWLRDEWELTDTKFMVSIAEKNRLRREGLAPVVFVHMDCHTASDRSHYMRLLQQYIKIDSYSKCEHNKDFPATNLTFERLNGMAPMMSDRFFKFIAQYKFTFAFENAVCDDYITEKFWRPLRLGIVPIVFGSSKIKDMAPSDHSIIDIRDFKSVKEVADLITSLDTNDAEYLKYLTFKQTGITNPVLKEELRKRDWGTGKPYGSHFNGFNCFVCDKLHEMKNQVRNGQPVTRWSGKFDHYGCPAPKVFDDQGRYVIEKNPWLEPFSYAEFYAHSLRYHIDNNINANLSEIHKYADRQMQQALRGGIRLSV